MFKNLNPGALGVSGHQSEIIELAMTYGFAGMDLNIVDFAITARAKGAAYAKRMIESAKLRIGTFSLPLSLEDEDETFQAEMKKLPELAGYAAELGCTRCTTMVAPAGDGRPYHENFEFHRHRLSEVCQTLQTAGIHLAVGFQAAEYQRRDRAFQFIHDFDALLLLLNMVAAPNLGVALDIWEVVACGGSLESVQKLTLNQIVTVQLADMPADVAAADLDDKSRLVPGAENGRIDFVALLTWLQQLGYDGPVTVKPLRGALPGRRRDLVVKQVSEALDKLWLDADLPGAKKPEAATVE